MKGLVVYHTKFGNCRKIAENIARGLEEAGLEVELLSSDVRKVSSDFDFIAVGSGTRMGRMTGGISRFIKREVRRDAWSGKVFLAFGTGGRPDGEGERMHEWSARGAQRIYEALEARGLKPIADAAKFYVEDIKGPLEEGEEKRALQLGLDTGKLLLQSTA
jgi:flavodoxin